jgi:hypothetical protein
MYAEGIAKGLFTKAGAKAALYYQEQQQLVI